MTDLGWRARFKNILKPWVPGRVISFYRQFREPLELPDRSEVTLFASPDVLPKYQPRQAFSPDIIPNEEREPVSLIATVYNEASNIGHWLDSLLTQCYLPNEIVITDGGSTDGTLEILRRYAENFPVAVQVITAPGANISRGRNLAIAAALHDIVACSDCGSVLDEDWLSLLTFPFALDPQINVSAGYYDVLESNRLSRLARRFFGVDLAAIDPQKFLPSGRSLAFRKRLWAEAGGYPEWLTDAGEDTLFDMRLKSQSASWAFVPEARVAWFAPDTLRKLLRTYFRYSFGDGETGISAGLYCYKVVELLRIWPRRLILMVVGLVLTWFWSSVGFIYFGCWLVWSLIRFWRENQSQKLQLNIGFYPYTVLLELVGMVQAVAFIKGVFNRPAVKEREIKFYQDQIQNILVNFPQRAGVMVYPPTHDWGFMFQRPHQIARAFAREGWLYFFCTANNRTDSVYGFQEIEPGLYLTQVPAKVFRSLENAHVYLGSARNHTWIPEFDRPLVIYDHYDDLDISGARLEDHFNLLQNADQVIVTAKRLLENVSSSRPDALLIPNGVDYEFIQSVKPSDVDSPPADLLPILGQGKPIIGYSGALAEWFDYDLLIQAANRYPDFLFVLVGVDYDGTLMQSRLLDQPNIYYLGLKNYQELFEYVWRFDIAVIPFKINDITLATSPVKLFEYMACEKPVVTTALPECRGFDGIFLAEDSAQFLNYLVEAMNKRDDESYLRLINKVAQENTWKQRTEAIITRLS